MLDVPILYIDDDLAVIDKPSGLLTQPGLGPELRDSVLVRLAGRFSAPLIVHRLDRDTSGLMVVALHAESHRKLSAAFREREVYKQYEACVAGTPPDHGVIDAPLRKDLLHPPRHCVDFEKGKLAQTEFQTLSTVVGRSRLLLRPLTGRSHQLRVHLCHAGHPILGDPLYGNAQAQRLCLHATELSLPHPRTGELVTWQSESPLKTLFPELY
jgi:tRNA pseudouridine32 synthase/23S rRNA pseudouridine746 synthase